MTLNTTTRFSDRVDNYVKYRPRYPDAVIDFFKSKLGLNSNHVIVDVGSGTGISSELFLKNGNSVFAVEPNKNMREGAKKSFNEISHFHSVDGSSEKTGLPNQCADFIIAAQAFHWFSADESKIEFARILKPDGKIILMWNDRKTTGSAFSLEYEGLINHFGTDYKQVNHKNIVEDRIRQFLGPFEVYHFANFQELDFTGLLGRLTSSSYAPNVGHPRYEEMCQALKDLFNRHSVNGLVRIEYDTQVFCSVTRPEFIKHYSEIQEGPESSYYKGTKEFLSIGSPFAKTFGLTKLGWYIHFYSDLGNKMFVIFKGKHFVVSKRKDSSWEPMIQFGESIGVERRWTETIPVEFKV